MLTANSSETVTVVSGYDKKTPVTLRRLSFNEALNGPHCLKFIDVNGMARDCRKNGAVKTWKTRPGNLSFPCKYGLKECWRSEMVNGEWKPGHELYLEV